MADAYERALQSTLCDIAAKHYEEYRLEFSPVYTAGAGYTSQLYRGRIIAPNKEDIKFFVKVAALGTEARTVLPTSIYFTEQYVYKRLAEIYKNIEDKHKVPLEHRFVFPIVYGYSDTELEEVIVLQDLAAEGFTVQDRFTSFDWHYASAAVQQIARFHALSIAMQHDFPEDYKEVSETFKFRKSKDQSMFNMVQQTANNSIGLIKPEYRERVEKYLEEYLPKAMATYYDIPPRPVLNHGDFRMSNIMHRKRQDGSVEAILIDYQILHISSCVKDLMFFIFTGSDAEFRRHHYQQLLQHYYNELRCALTTLDLHPDKVFPKEEFDADLKENQHLGLLFALHALPVVMVAEEKAPAPSEVLGMENFMQIEATQLCKDRLNEVVEDFIALGVI
ncbi:unnamed protein product [Chilo suppressalis]|uniref:CHK kinase-like domain-containing protein n=1 Tax=Chilo suppressalis TaxID=168631 RepID=A0ABN8B0H9_CHISP|nr:unnamed protein product [Chilo suppressalis]